MAKQSKEDKPEGKDKKTKGKRRGGDAESKPEGASVANHPRARNQVRSAKGWGGLVCFVIAGGFSLEAGDPGFQALLQALIAGVIGCLLAWACTVLIWRQVLMAEQRIHVEQLRKQWEEEQERRRVEAEAIAAQEAAAQS